MQMGLRRWAVFAAVLLLAACVSVDTEKRSKLITKSRAVVEKSFTIGETATARVGEPLMRVRNYSEKIETADFLMASEAFRLKGFGEDLDFEKGARFVIVGERQVNDQTYTVANVQRWGVDIQVAPDGSISPTLINIDVEMIYSAQVEPATVRLIRGPYSRVTNTLTDLNYDLIFAGIDGQSMRFQFREYGGTSLTAPIASQDVTFPLGTAQIQYRSLKVDILSVSPTEVTYKVRSALEPPEPAPMPPPPPPVSPSVSG